MKSIQNWKFSAFFSLSVFLVFSVCVAVEAYSAPFALEFQGINGFEEKLYMDTGFYSEIKSFLFKRDYSRKYGFCIEPYDTCPYSYYFGGPYDFQVDPETFESPARAIIPLELISEAIKRYSPQKFRVELPTEILKEMLPEVYEEVKKYPPSKLTFDVELKDVYVREKASYDDDEEFKGECWKNIKYMLVSEFKVDIAMYLGKTYFNGRLPFLSGVSFKLPITINIGSWVPPVISPGGEGRMESGTIYITFGTCKTEIFPELPIWTRDIFPYQNYEDFEMRLKKIISYVLYIYLGSLDFKPVVFPILNFFNVEVKKIYLGTLKVYHFSIGENQLRSIILEFYENPATGVDPFEPEFSLISVPYKYLRSYSVSFSVSATESIKYIMYRLDGGAWSGWIEMNELRNFPLEVSNLIQGKHKIEVISQNIHGRVNEIPKSIEFFVDRTPPEYEINIPKFSNKFSAEIKAWDNSDGKIISSVKIKDLSGGTVFEKTEKFTYSVTFTESEIPEGSYKVFVSISDEAGNFAEEKSFDIIIDKTPPVIRPVYLPEKYSKYDKEKIVVEFEDNFFAEGEIEYFVEEFVSERRFSCFSQWGETKREKIKKPLGEVNITGLRNEKTYHVCFRAVDLAGNSGQTFEILFTVDTSPPEIKLVEFPRRITIETSLKFLVIAKDNITPSEKINFFWTFDEVEKVLPFRFGDSLMLSLRNIKDGKHKLTVYAIDEAGNASKYEEFEFIVDTSLRFLGGGKGIKVGCSSSYYYQFQSNGDFQNFENTSVVFDVLLPSLHYIFTLLFFLLFKRTKARTPSPTSKVANGIRK